MELLKFIAGEILHIEPKTFFFFFFYTWSWVSVSAALHQRWRGQGCLQSWLVGRSISPLVQPSEARGLPHPVRVTQMP